MRIKVLVISQDDTLRKQLEEAAFWQENKMEVLRWASSKEEFSECFEEVNPRLVILDQDVGDTIEMIASIHSKKEKCRILVTGSRNDAAFLYAVFQAKVFGYLGKPICMDEVNAELCKVSEDIREVTVQAIVNESQCSMRSLYFWKIMFEDSQDARDFNFINHIAGVYFKPGIFRVVLFRFDQINGEIPKFDQTYYFDINALQSKIKACTNKYLYEYCYDMIFDFRFNGVLAVLNYKKEFETLICDRLEMIRSEASCYSISKQATVLTVCCGGGYEDFGEVRKSRDEAYNVAWSRLRRGKGKVMYFSKKHDMQESYRKRLEQIILDLKMTAKTVNNAEFHRLLDELFSLPEYVLTDYRSKELVLEYVDTFFEVNHEALSGHMRVENEKEHIRKILNFSNTLTDYRKNLTDGFDVMYRMLAEDLEKQNIRPLRQAIHYIKSHYSEPITAECLAEIVNLNPVYFSHLFKKQTGMNMTEYIANYRMEIAKELLLDTEIPISNVGLAVGFNDQRYFAKRFKQAVGMTPTEYRKLK